MNEIEKLEQGIAALEAQRAVLGEAVVDAMLVPVRARLAALKTQQSRLEQRKQVTVLFADMPNFTAMAETLDAEEVQGQVNQVWARLDAIITAHGGVIDKHIGDAVMALWGIEQVREDDAERAIRAALAMQAELASFRVEHGAAVAMRIGVNTGLVMLGVVGSTGEYTAMGDTVNLASRLENAAPVGGILIAHSTYQQVRGVFDVQAQAPQAVKGKAEPVRTYVVLRAKPRAFRLRTRGVEGVETRMVGRQLELQQLQDAIQQVIAERSLQVITVVGEAGIGKSRLLYEFQNWLELLPVHIRIFKGRATEITRGLPYGLLRDIFAFRFEIADSDPLAEAREKLEQGIVGLMSDDEEAALKAHFIGHLIGLDFSDSPYLRGILDDPKQIRDRGFHYLLQFFAAAARTGNMAAAVLFLDDLHWADDNSLEAFSYLQRMGSDLPLLMLGLTRPILFERPSQWQIRQCIDLLPLSDQESRQLVGEILKKVPDAPSALCDLVAGGAEGNPFYLEELVKMLIDQNVIFPGDDVWLIEPARLSNVHMPSTLTGVLQARLDGLPVEMRETLQRAAVIGRVFWDSAVAALDNTALSDVHFNLDGLCRRELIYGREFSAFDQAKEYIFKHTLLRDVTYETVLKRLRRVYHARAAEWLIEHGQERAGEYAGLIAEHFEQSEQARQAAEWYGRAGKQAADAYAPETALDFYQKALSIAADQDFPASWKIVWYDGLARALRARARYGEAIKIYTTMYSLAEITGDMLFQARALNGLARAQERQGNYQASLEHAERAVDLANRALQAGEAWAGGASLMLAMQAELAEALHGKGWALYRLGDAAGAILLAEQVIGLCNGLEDVPAIRRARANGLKVLGSTYAMLGRFGLARENNERALALFRELGDRQMVGVMLNNLGAGEYYRGDYLAAARYYQEALAVVQQIGYRNAETMLTSNLGGTRVGLGDYAAAEADLRKAISLAGTTGWLVEAYCFLAEACLGQGKVAEAQAAAQQALQLGQAEESQEYIGGAWRILGKVASMQVGVPSVGLVESASAPAGLPSPSDCFAESLRIFTENGMEAERARTLRDWARVAARQGDRQKAEVMWQEAQATFMRLGMELEAARMDKTAW